MGIIPTIDTCSFGAAESRCNAMELIITTGMRSEERFVETHRWSIDVASDATISAVLERVKHECVPTIPALNREAIKPHLYLVLAESFERLDNEKTVKDYELIDGSILHLMSAVR
jgi:hypothetical protein